VTNTGTGTLYLGTPSVTGTGFWRGAKVLRSYLEPGQSDTFDVKFSSTSAGTFTGEVILWNSDANESPYNFAVRALNNHAPTNISLSPSTIVENFGVPGHIYVGTLTATDPDAGDTHTFAIDPTFGDGARFSESAGVIYANQPFDFEDPHGPSYSIRVTATDSAGLSFTKTLTITITNVNEAPTDILLNPASIAENSGLPSHIYVGDLTATDQDAGDTHTFALDSTFGDGSKFSIGGNTVYARQPFDFEDVHGPAYSIKVTATDAGGLSFTKTLTITVTDVNEAPVISPNQQFAIDENPLVGANVGTVAFTDPDTADTHTVAITGGNTGNAFTIDNAGVITVRTPAAIDFETTSSFTLTITVTDSGSPALSDTKTVVVTVNDVSEAPRIIDLDTRTTPLDDPTVTISLEVHLGPNNGSYSLVTKMRATDDDVGHEDALHWIIAGGNTEGLFGIPGSGSDVDLVINSPLTNATKATYELFIEVYDPTGLVDQGTVTVNIKSVIVGFVVDTHAVEGSALDDIKITFYRFAIGNNYNDALDVYVEHNLPATEPTAGGLAITDFDGDAAGLALLTTKQITIPAGQQSISVTLTAFGDGLPENLEGEQIHIVAPPANASPYHVVTESSPVPNEDYLQLYAAARLEVLDAWTLFADGTPTALDGDPVHYNDVDQNGIGDCFCLAAVAELAVTHSSVIYSSLQRVGTTDEVTVRYFDQDGNEQTTSVIVNLDRGFNGAGLSGDYDSTGVEVWTWVIERAYAQTHGNYCNINGGHADDAWKWLTGHDASELYSDGKTDQQIWDEIESNFGNSHQNGVIVDSPPNAPILGVGENHSWAVLAVRKTTAGSPLEIEVYNPWSGSNSHRTVPFADLNENILRVIVGEF
jgi:VCBS repeat-containing protein